MRKLFICAVIAASIWLMSACNSGQPDYSTPEAFLRDFVSALENEQSGRFGLFFLQSGDFDPNAPAADLALERFMGTVREEFLQRCRGAASFMQGKKVVVDGIQFRDSNPRAVMFLKNVKENHSNITIRLAIGAQKARIEVEEVIQIEEAWRLTQFLLIVEEEVEWGGEIELDASKSTITEEEVIQNDEEDEEVDQEK